MTLVLIKYVPHITSHDVTSHLPGGRVSGKSNCHSGIRRTLTPGSAGCKADAQIITLSSYRYFGKDHVIIVESLWLNYGWRSRTCVIRTFPTFWARRIETNLCNGNHCRTCFTCSRVFMRRTCSSIYGTLSRGRSIRIFSKLGLRSFIISLQVSVSSILDDGTLISTIYWFAQNINGSLCEMALSAASEAVNRHSGGFKSLPPRHFWINIHSACARMGITPACAFHGRLSFHAHQ